MPETSFRFIFSLFICLLDMLVGTPRFDRVPTGASDCVPTASFDEADVWTVALGFHIFDRNEAE